MFYFDVRLNQWKNPPSTGSLPAPRGYANMAANRSRDKIFVYGGYDAKQQFGGMYMYDVTLNRWDKIASRGEKPTTRMNHSLTFIAPNHLIMFGGRERSTRQNDLFLFDIATSTWKRLSHEGESVSSQRRSGSQRNSDDGGDVRPSSAPTGRTAHTAVRYVSRSHLRSANPVGEERILIFGGYAGSHVWLNDLQLLTVPSEAVKQALVPAGSGLDRNASRKGILVLPLASSVLGVAAMYLLSHLLCV